MLFFHADDDLPAFRRPVVTVGSFDGVHRGHRALLDAAVRTAAEKGVESIAVTFDPHPRKVLRPWDRTWLLSPLEEKKFLLSQSGVDCTIIIPFDEAFSRMGSDDFINGIVSGRLGAGSMVVGYDHRFGRNKEGDYGLLRNTGLEIIRIPELKTNGLKISSTEVRHAVLAGDMCLAEEILGHPYIISGTVTGTGGIRIPDQDKLLPPAGSYRVETGGFQNELIISPGGELSLKEGAALPEIGKVVLSFL